ncbi:MAG TPA: 30S ribosome-binding factor RbfA [Chloroflexota bacterium]|nr:30S ribosome-binding factor RbfA [Chloroflexota bacterium]
MSERRQQRVAEEIQRRASQFIREELKDPRLGFLTITGVDVNADLTHATIYVSVLGDESEQAGTMTALRSAKGLIKRDIGDWLRIRTVPEIAFKQDLSIERGTRVLEIMKTLHEEHA